MNFKDLPVYRERASILKQLKDRQVIVVESPTGSGKTTLLPLILHEGGYADHGLIGVTQPRRIAAVSVSRYIARLLDSPFPGIAGYKMRFEDTTLPETKIKIMTDGILLQELKGDPLLSRYSVLMIDEAHERSLTIDFILGLLKDILKKRPEFRVIVSSATINTEIFSSYFDRAPVFGIRARSHPVEVFYRPPPRPALPPEQKNPRGRDGNRRNRRGQRGSSKGGGAPLFDETAFFNHINALVSEVLSHPLRGDILIFLPGEKAIKTCIRFLEKADFASELLLFPLYGRLGYEEQEKVFTVPPPGKIKVVVATNIAETSITVDGVTAVIDSGQGKINSYDPQNYTAALVECPVSRSSAEQRTGRAGRTRPGLCFRLYEEKDFEKRPPFPEAEILRTELTEVLLRMIDIGIKDFEHFDFISAPDRETIVSAVKLLFLFGAIDEDRELTSVGEMMTLFPLSPRHSRMIVEAVTRYPEVLRETLTAASFLSNSSPFLLPVGSETEAREAHRRFYHPYGDIPASLLLFKAFAEARQPEEFCRKFYLDFKAMNEIYHVREQLEEIVSRKLEIPVTSGGSTEALLCACGKGLLQFICRQSKSWFYQTMAAENIMIHPGSLLFKEKPLYMMAGEIVKTSRTYARSVSLMKESWLKKISPEILKILTKPESSSPQKQKRETSAPAENLSERNFRGVSLQMKKLRGQTLYELPWDRLASSLRNRPLRPEEEKSFKSCRLSLFFRNRPLLENRKPSLIFKILRYLDPDRHRITRALPSESFHPSAPGESPVPARFTELLSLIPAPVPVSGKNKQTGFCGLYTDFRGEYRFQSGPHFYSVLGESMASLEQLLDELNRRLEEDSGTLKGKAGASLDRLRSQIRKTYRFLNEIYLS